MMLVCLAYERDPQSLRAQHLKRKKHNLTLGKMSFSLLKNDCVILNKYLKFASFKSVSFYDRFWDSNRVNSGGLLNEFSLDQRSHLRNAYIWVLINSFYVETNVEERKVKDALLKAATMNGIIK